MSYYLPPGRQPRDPFQFLLLLLQGLRAHQPLRWIVSMFLLWAGIILSWLIFYLSWKFASFVKDLVNGGVW